MARQYYDPAQDKSDPLYVVHVKIPTSHKDELKHYAAKRQRSYAYVIREAVAEKVAEVRKLREREELWDRGPEALEDDRGKGRKRRARAGGVEAAGAARKLAVVHRQGR